MEIQKQKLHTLMKLYKSRYQTILYDKQMSYLEFQWNDFPKATIEKSLKKEIDIQIKILHKHKVANFLFDTSDLNIEPEISIPQKISYSFERHLSTPYTKKVAFVLNDSVETLFPIDFIVDKSLRQNITTQFFDTKEEALSWINN